MISVLQYPAMEMYPYLRVYGEPPDFLLRVFLPAPP